VQARELARQPPKRPIDLTEPDAVTRLASAISGRWDALDIMVLSAAYLPHLSPVTQIDAKQFNKAMMTNVIATQAQEVQKLGDIRVAIVDPGATRTEMRARAYPGEDPETVKSPDVVANHILGMLNSGFETGHRSRVDAP